MAGLTPGAVVRAGSKCWRRCGRTACCALVAPGRQELHGACRLIRLGGVVACGSADRSTSVPLCIGHWEWRIGDRGGAPLRSACWRRSCQGMCCHCWRGRQQWQQWRQRRRGGGDPRIGEDRDPPATGFLRLLPAQGASPPTQPAAADVRCSRAVASGGRLRHALAPPHLASRRLIWARSQGFLKEALQNRLLRRVTSLRQQRSQPSQQRRQGPARSY